MVVSEDESVDESVPINMITEKKTKSYKETTIQDINNIETYETRTKVNTTKWRPIYEVIHEVYIKESKISPEDLSENVNQFKQST